MPQIYSNYNGYKIFNLPNIEHKTIGVSLKVFYLRFSTTSTILSKYPVDSNMKNMKHSKGLCDTRSKL